MKDGSRRRMQVVSASRAIPRLALLLGFVPLKHLFLFAFGAVRVLAIGRVAGTPEPFKAGRIVGVLAHELHKGLLRFRGLTTNRVAPIYWCHTSIVPNEISPVKG